MKNKIETLADGDFRVVPLDDPAFIEFTNKRNMNMEAVVKIAINRCYGGFGISDEAFEKLLTRKGIAFDKVESEHKSLISGVTYYAAGHSGDDDHFLSEYDFCSNRSDPDLIAVIEEMGDAVNGFAADIVIVEVPDDVKWHIHEYDGLEHVAEDHRTWS
jgi:hypothetical protein